MQSEIKLSIAQCHVDLSPGGSAVGLDILCSTCPWSVLEIQAPHLGAEWKHFGKGDAVVVEAVQGWFWCRGAANSRLEGAALGWNWDSYNYLHIKSVSLCF